MFLLLSLTLLIRSSSSVAVDFSAMEHAVTEPPKPNITRPIRAVPQEPEIETRVDLKEMFPQSIRLAFARSFVYLLGLVLVVIGYVVIAMQLPSPQASSMGTRGVDFLLRSTLYVAVLISGGKLIYELLCFWVYRYRIELEHIVIERGIFFRTRSAVPLARIHDVTLLQTPIDMLFGLRSLTILTASPTESHGEIEGLPSKVAFAFQAFLLALVETTLPDVRERTAAEIIKRAANEEREHEYELA